MSNRESETWYNRNVTSKVHTISSVTVRPVIKTEEQKILKIL